MRLCQAWTSTPTQAMASSGPVLTNSSDSTVWEKLLADSCNTQTRQFTRLNSILVIALTEGGLFSLLVWSEQAEKTTPEENHLDE